MFRKQAERDGSQIVFGSLTSKAKTDQLYYGNLDVLGHPTKSVYKMLHVSKNEPNRGGLGVARSEYLLMSIQKQYLIKKLPQIINNWPRNTQQYHVFSLRMVRFSDFHGAPSEHWILGKVDGTG